MGETWRTLKTDPVILDLRVVIEKGLYGFSSNNLTVLPQLLGTSETAAIRDRLLSLLMIDDPREMPTSKSLGQSTRFNLALFGATSATKLLTATGRRIEAGTIYRPANPVSADGVRKHPSAKQPMGGPEWRLLFLLHEQILAKYPTRSVTRAKTSGHGPSPLPPTVAATLGHSWRNLHHLMNSRPANAQPVPTDIRDAIAELSRPIDYILHTFIPDARR